VTGVDAHAASATGEIQDQQDGNEGDGFEIR
jgi:hypothetical protein